MIACAGRRAAPPPPLEIFPFLEEADDRDRAVIRAQLGKPFVGEVFVARRCPHGAPAVLLTLPFAAAGGAVPPLLWLTCPSASKAVGGLESRGEIARVGERLCGDPALLGEFMRQERMLSSMQQRIAEASGGEELANRVASRGAAYGRVGSMKCLHAHLACHLALGGECRGGTEPGGGTEPRHGGARSIPGELCAEKLEEEGGVWCERPPAPCVT